MSRAVLRTACLVALASLLACVQDEGDDVAEGEAAIANTWTFRLDAGAEERAMRALPQASDADRERAGFHLPNAYWMARLADYAYWPKDVVQQKMKELHADVAEFRFFANPCTGAQAFYVRTREAAVLAFRGSDQLAEDWVRTNGNARKVEWYGPGLVHDGFRNQFGSLWVATPCELGSEGGRMDDFVRSRHRYDARTGAPQGGPLYVTGHSLGGGLATLMLAHVQTDTCHKDASCTKNPLVPVTALYTFGTPKVGDETFAITTAERARGRTPYFRVVHADDPVPYFPRNLFPEGTDFRHVGYRGLAGEAAHQVYVKRPGTLEIAKPVFRGGYRFDDHGLWGYVDTLRDLAKARGQLR